MKTIKFFKEIRMTDVGEAGGKGASLGEMTSAGIPVPPGFVVLSGAFDKFLGETDLGVDVEAILKKVNYKDVNSVDRASNEIRELILDAEMPADIKKEILADFTRLDAKLVAVRSSATAEDSKVASWAGELDTYLNTTKPDLLENVKKCWSSLYTSRAIFYRHERGLLKTRVSVAVVVQKMVQSEVSGITFTVHPVTEDRNQMLIEAGYGLGEAIVSGTITPDSYVINKEKLSLMDVNIARQEKMLVKKGKVNKYLPVGVKAGNKQKLSNKQIMNLAKICSKIEKHYGFPCDIEWACEKNKFYIVQSRPITTLK